MTTFGEKRDQAESGGAAAFAEHSGMPPESLSVGMPEHSERSLEILRYLNAMFESLDAPLASRPTPVG